jgi:hypothetical protein
VRKADKPDPAMVYDWFTAIASNPEGLAHWNAPNAPIQARSITAARHAEGVEKARKSIAHYEDVHVSTFTPESFAQHMALAAQFGIIPDLRVTAIAPTPHGELEFLVVLKKA